jgi:ribonucleoside-diphosphate reductase subunit M1
VCVRNLNRVIDVGYYPIPEARASNVRHRPIGVGVQGLADAFVMMGVPFDSDEAMRLDARIFETIYYHAVDESCELAAASGAYSSFAGSPASEGRLQIELWEEELAYPLTISGWGELREKAKRGMLLRAV